MRLLVTGGLGFIGSNLVRHLLKAYPSYEVINLDAQTYAGHLENLEDITSNPRYKFVKGRIEDATLVNSIVSGDYAGPIDGILNLAAESHVDRSIEDPMVFVNSNVVGTQVLLEAAFKHGLVHGTRPGVDARFTIRYVQISTDEVYGSLGATGFFTESTPLAPNSPYSASKAGSDMLCRAYFHTFAMPVMITRCSNNYGPYQHPEKLIPLFINNLMNNKQVPVYGDGKNVRDWLHVEDHCRAIDAVFHKGLPGEVYNIGGNNERTNMQITKLLLSELGKGEQLIRYVEDRLGHDRRYAIDSTKIQTELGWEPKHTFETGIRETINWYKKNQVWLAKVTGKHVDAVALEQQAAAAAAAQAAAQAVAPPTTII
ncbi:MAG: dTDP-glucose 4,6-dehydratase [Candidatus Obscuribacterales bacterium]|nr:dTDP-glucose 4,6-dehydratase [Candidatus Obscuribacterales bacterium]